MKLKPIIICDDFNLTRMSALEKGAFLNEIETHFKDPQNLEKVATIWSTGVVYQDTIVVLRDTDVDLVNDGVGFTWELRAGWMMQMVQLQYETDEISMELFRMERFCGVATITSWYANIDVLEAYADEIEKLVTPKQETEVI